MLYQSSIKLGAWTEQEDALLCAVVEELGTKNWSAVADRIGGGRSGKSCRLRWHNQLDPSVNKLPFTEWEQAVIFKAQEDPQYASRWAATARLLQRRTDNAVKNHWNATLTRRVRRGTFKNRYLEEGVSLEWLLAHPELRDPEEIAAGASSKRVMATVRPPKGVRKRIRRPRRPRSEVAAAKEVPAAAAATETAAEAAETAACQQPQPQPLQLADQQPTSAGRDCGALPLNSGEGSSFAEWADAAQASGAAAATTPETGDAPIAAALVADACSPQRPLSLPMRRGMRKTAGAQQLSPPLSAPAQVEPLRPAATLPAADDTCQLLLRVSSSTQDSYMSTAAPMEDAVAAAASTPQHRGSSSPALQNQQQQQQQQQQHQNQQLQHSLTPTVAAPTAMHSVVQAPSGVTLQFDLQPYQLQQLPQQQSNQQQVPPPVQLSHRHNSAPAALDASNSSLQCSASMQDLLQREEQLLQQRWHRQQALQMLLDQQEQDQRTRILQLAEQQVLIDHRHQMLLTTGAVPPAVPVLHAAYPVDSMGLLLPATVQPPIPAMPLSAGTTCGGPSGTPAGPCTTMPGHAVLPLHAAGGPMYKHESQMPMLHAEPLVGLHAPPLQLLPAARAIATGLPGHHNLSGALAPPLALQRSTSSGSGSGSSSASLQALQHGMPAATAVLVHSRFPGQAVDGAPGAQPAAAPAHAPGVAVASSMPPCVSAAEWDCLELLL